MRDHVVQLDRVFSRAETGRQACRVVARVVLEGHVAEREDAGAAPLPEKAAPLVEGPRPLAAADGDAADGRAHCRVMNIEHAVARHHAVAVHDAHAGARAGDRQALGNVEVAQHGEIIVTRSRQRVRARRQDDGVRAHGEVGLHDRRAQRALAVARGADVVPLIGVGQILGAVDEISVASAARRRRQRDQQRRERSNVENRASRSSPQTTSDHLQRVRSRLPPHRYG